MVDHQVENGETGAVSPELEPLFSLVAGEGDGFMLGLAAGDSAGGAWELGYSAVTEQATIIAYELIQHRRIDHGRLVAALLELDGADGEEKVYRAETPFFRAWLDRAGSGEPNPDLGPSLDGVGRAPVTAVAFRRDPGAMFEETIAMSRLFDSDPGSLISACVAAAAVAASCYAQSGRDLVAGVAEALPAALEQLTGTMEIDDRLAQVPALIHSLVGRVGVRDGEEALDAAGGDGSDPVQLTVAALLLAAPVTERHHVAVEQAARIAGSTLGAFAGSVIGARVGIRAWPWAFANDTWFAEIGRRLVRGPDEIRDLPIPYAVEQHLMYGSRPPFD